MTRIAVVGGGIAGTVLAWRIRQSWTWHRPEIDLFSGDRSAADATAASGGAVRGFEIDPESARIAAESLEELRGSSELREWSGYRETGSVYLVPGHVAHGPGIQALDRILPGSVEVVAAADLAKTFPFHALPEETVGVFERHSGYYSPARLRNAVLARIGPSVTIVSSPAVEISLAPSVRTGDGTVRGYDVVVVAAGAWTPLLLEKSGISGTGFRTKQIQYSAFDVVLPGLVPFVEETSGF